MMKTHKMIFRIHSASTAVKLSNLTLYSRFIAHFRTHKKYFSSYKSYNDLSMFVDHFVQWLFARSVCNSLHYDLMILEVLSK